MPNLTSQLIVKLVDGVTGPSTVIAASLKRLTSMQTANSAQLAAVRGELLTAGAVAYGFAKALSAPVQSAMEFESKLEDIRQKIDATKESMPALGDAIKQVATDTANTASDMAKGFDILVGKGATNEQATKMLGSIGMAATAYKAEISDLSSAAYSAVDNLKVLPEHVGLAVDAMGRAGKEGAFELKDMSRYFQALGSAYQGLKQTGVPAVADLAAALQVVRKGSGDASEAATNLTNVIQKMSSRATAKNFEKLGVDLEKEMKSATEAGLTPLEAIANVAEKAIGGDLSKIGLLWEDREVQKGMRALIQFREEYKKIREAALASAGDTEKDFKERLETTEGAMRQLKSASQLLSLEIGSALLPAVSSIARALIPVVSAIARFARENPALTRTIVGLTAGLIGLRVAALAAQFGFLWMKGALIGAAAMSLRGLSAALFVLGAPLKLIGAGLAYAKVQFIAFRAAAMLAGTGGALKILGASLLGLLSPMALVRGALVALRFALLATGIGAIAVGIAMAGMWIYKNWSNLGAMFSAFGSAFMAAIAPVQPILQPVIDLVTRLWNAISGLFGATESSRASFEAFGASIGTSVGAGVTAAIQAIERLVMWVRTKFEELSNLFSELPRKLTAGTVWEGLFGSTQTQAQAQAGETTDANPALAAKRKAHYESVKAAHNARANALAPTPAVSSAVSSSNVASKLDSSGAAAAAGSATGTGFLTELTSKLDEAVSKAQAAGSQIKSALTFSTNVDVRVNGVGGALRGAYNAGSNGG